METLKAIEYLRFRMQHSKMTIGDKERKAINQIILHYNASVKRSQDKNKLLIKMILHDFIYKSAYRKIGAKNALKAINDKLSVDIEEYYTKFIEDAKLDRFTKMLEDSGYEDLYHIPLKDRDNQKLVNEAIIKNNQERLEYLILDGYSREQMARFIKNYIHDIILKNS